MRKGLPLLVLGLVAACGGGSGGDADAGEPSDGGAATDAGRTDGAGPDAAEGDAGGGPYAALVEDTAYEADEDPDRLDPERGIYYWSPRTDDPHTLVGEWLYLGEQCDQELTWAGPGDAGTSPVLDDYAAALEAHRAAGRKIVFRPRYDVAGDDTVNDCGVFQAQTEELTRRHVAAIAAMLAEYRDVVAFVEAGYLGRWGEWNTSGYDDAVAPILVDPARRRSFLDHVIQTYREAGLDRFVGVRRPIFAHELSETHAGSGEVASLYNDCFMTNATDMGTYSNYESDNPYNFASAEDARAFAEERTADVPFGGETCPATDPRWASCDAMVGASSEPASLHMSYLHGAWAATARETWEDGGCYDEIKRRLGYRFELERVSYPPSVAPGERVRVHVDVRNTGWSRMHNPRQAYVVLRGEGEPLLVDATLDGYDTLAGASERGAVRNWLPGETTRLTVSFAPPAAGTYAVHLLLPDPDRPDVVAYAVRLASVREGAPLFDEPTGENDLGVTITVTE